MYTYTSGAQARERGMEAMAVAADVVPDDSVAGPKGSQLDQFIGNIASVASPPD